MLPVLAYLVLHDHPRQHYYGIRPAGPHVQEDLGPAACVFAVALGQHAYIAHL